MAMTLHRNDDSRGRLTVRKLLSPYLGLSLAEAESQKRHGRFGIAIYAMIYRKVELAKDSTDYNKLQVQIDTLVARVDKAVSQKAKDWVSLFDDPTDSDLAIAKEMLRKRNHATTLDEIETLQSRQRDIANTNDKAALDAGMMSLMGKDTKKSAFPATSTVYTCYNNPKIWKELAFCVNVDGFVKSVYVANGEGWDKVEALTGIHLTSTRLIQKIHYVFNAGGEDEIKKLLALVTANGFTVETYNPFHGIKPGQKAQVKSSPLHKWEKRNL